MELGIFGQRNGKAEPTRPTGETVCSARRYHVFTSGKNSHTPSRLSGRPCCRTRKSCRPYTCYPSDGRSFWRCTESQAQYSAQSRHNCLRRRHPSPGRMSNTSGRSRVPCTPLPGCWDGSSSCHGNSRNFSHRTVNWSSNRHLTVEPPERFEAPDLSACPDTPCFAGSSGRNSVPR